MIDFTALYRRPASARRRETIRAVIDPPLSVEDKHRICLPCPHLISEVRCGNLDCGCAKSANRMEPWKNLPRCARWKV